LRRVPEIASKNKKPTSMAANDTPVGSASDAVRYVVAAVIRKPAPVIARTWPRRPPVETAAIA
jgi:hypothetical protein